MFRCLDDNLLQYTVGFQKSTGNYQQCIHEQGCEGYFKNVFIYKLLHKMSSVM